jgi:hypothetical protein
MVHKARKFSAVLGTTSRRSSMIMRPASFPPIVISKNTFGFGPSLGISLSVAAGVEDPQPMVVCVCVGVCVCG